MAAAITKAGESLIAQKQAAGEVLEVVRFVLALVPGLDPDGPVDRDGQKPPPEQIVHTQAWTQKGFVNPNQVVYSLMMGSDLGDFDWNWIGLETVEGVLLSVGYVPVQQKRKNIPPHQIGNNVTRNFMVVFDGAQALTAITVDASTWQHDFTVSLHDIDELERLSNRDVFGRACFFGNSFQLVVVEGAYHLSHGPAYLEGIRVELGAVLPVVPPVLPATAWLDVSLARQDSSPNAAFSIVWGEALVDYVDSAGVQHYLIPLANLPDSVTITDRRVVEPIGGPLVAHFAVRVGTYPSLRAQATTKEDVGLDQLPNAKSDDPATNSSEILATTAALNNLGGQINDALAGMVAAFAMPAAPQGWIACNGTHLSRLSYPKLFARVGTTFGAGYGVTAFVVPDLRGRFLRAWDDSGTIDPGRLLGSHQGGQNAWHDHTASSAANGGHSHPGSATFAAGTHGHTGWTHEAGSHSHVIQVGNTSNYNG